jgi:hypothetical protein
MARPNVIRDVGDTLVLLLQGGLGDLVQPTNIYLAGADELGNVTYADAPVVTIFLYRIAVNAETRNGPRRTLADGSTTRPLLPIDLHFMLTPWTNVRGDEYHIAGRILQLLYDNAELGPTQLQGDAWATGDSVQIVLESLPLDDHYRIWDSTDSTYRLSLTYLARVIGIEPGESTSESRVLDAEFRRSRNE